VEGLERVPKTVGPERMLESFDTRSASESGLNSLTGSFGTSLLVFSSFAIVLGAAISRRGAGADRWAIASSLILVLQALSALAAALPLGAALAAPLARLMSAAVPPLVAWAALGPQSRPASDRALGACLTLCAVLFAATLLDEPPAGTFNVSWVDQAWSLLALALALASTITVLARRPPAWGAFALGLGFMTAGVLAHIGAAPGSSDIAPALAVGLAAGAPIVAMGAVLALLQEPQPDASAAVDAERVRLERALRAVIRLGVAEDVPSFAGALTEGIGIWLTAEYCLLLTPPRSPGGLSIGAGFDHKANAAVSPTPLEADGCPVLSQSLERCRSVHLPAATHAPDSATVLAALGLEGTSPGLMVPLTSRGKAVAGLLLLSPRAAAEWNESTRIALERLAPSFGERLERLMESSSQGPALDVAKESLEQARARIAELESQQDGSPDDEPTWVGVDEVKVELERAHQTIDLMQAEMDRLRGAIARPAAPAPAEVDSLQAELALALAALAEARQGSGQPGSPRVDPSSSGAFLHALEDIRHPLTAIAGYTDLLLGESIGLLGATQRKFLQRIRTAALRMEQALAGLTDGAGGRAPGASDTADLAACIEGALEVIQEDLRARNLSVRLDLTQDSSTVAGRPADVRRIVSDLLANAAAASPSGREIHVTLHTDPIERVAILAVSDRGRGVPADDLHRVFTAKRWRDPVLGLGLDSRRLAAVKTMAESLGGRAWVESDEKEGTTFFILLPTAEPG
jgi:signal transduction histidine kinase